MYYHAVLLAALDGRIGADGAVGVAVVLRGEDDPVIDRVDDILVEEVVAVGHARLDRRDVGRQQLGVASQRDLQLLHQGAEVLLVLRHSAATGRVLPVYVDAIEFVLPIYVGNDKEAIIKYRVYVKGTIYIMWFI